MKVIRSNADLERIHAAGVGLVYNDYSGKGLTGKDYNVLHAASCAFVLRSKVQGSTRIISKYFFNNIDEAERWLRWNRGDEGRNWKRCGTCRAEVQPTYQASLQPAPLPRIRPAHVPRNQIGAVVVDPTVLSTRERLKVFLESMVFKEYSSFLPSPISSLIREEKWNELITLLRQWEWTLDSRESEEWFNSPDFKDLCKRLAEVCISFEDITEELSQDDRKTLSIVRDILGPESPTVVDLAKELVTIAITKQAGIVSFTRHLKRWLKSLRGVLILEISEKTGKISDAKADIKRRFKNAKLKGKIFLTFISLAASVAVTAVLPPGLNLILGSILASLGERVIIGLIINGIP